MEILTYNYPAARFSENNINDVFKEELSKSDIVRIASGYISSSSLVELKKTIEINKKPKLELLIGMHYYDGFTKNQWNAACELNNFLVENNLGEVFISVGVKFHGKVYSFCYNENSYTSLVGSSNISSVLDALENLYEFDIFITDINKSKEINTAVTNIISKFGSSLRNIKPKIIENVKPVLEDYGIERASDIEIKETLNSLTNISFEIPLKTEPKSNLNVFFGTGRRNQRGYTIPRPWYEVELIVSNSITENDFYPNGTFEVITDDGWKFNCKTSGDYHKNFRSESDLKILGRWIKGRLENAEALKVGEMFTEDVKREYGRNSLTLTKTSKSNTWYLDFKKP
ncbi:MAG: NgoFVII family restriction endonuclease [Ignavibacteria bacterium]|nr:NgoFVII family restriction endonuclease [Ignavibacteria bacterium]